MSSTDVALSPTKKTKQQKMEQIVSSDVNGSDSNDSESVSQPELINNQSETTNKDCRVDDDACMEPLLIQDCVIDDKFVTTNSINETNCALSDENSESPVSVCDIADSGGGFMKTNLSLNLSAEKILSDDEKATTLPKNKKFLDSTDDQIMNQIFFQTISVTPTTEDVEVLLTAGGGKYIGGDNTPLTPNEIDAELIVGPVDFFNRKIDEDDVFDTTYTDTAENYQESDGNLCSLNDNFNDNYCSFSSIDYNPTNVQRAQENDEEAEDEKTPPLAENELLLGAYAEQMRQQRPSIVIDCYDSDSKTEEEEEEEANVVIGDEKINDYCFYFDQTIEEDDDDACYISDNLNDVNLKETTTTTAAAATTEVDSQNGKTSLDAQGEGENDIDECFETETESDTDDVPNEEDDDDKSDDEGVINESCISVNVSGPCY
jgi:hypothetical protein